MLYNDFMSIEDFLKKIKNLPEDHPDVFIGIVITLVAFGSFGMGRLSVSEVRYEPVSVRAVSASVAEAVLSDARADGSPAPAAGGEVVGSRNGSKYHFPWCGSARRIKKENLVTFASVREARDAGYTPAANCKGLR